MMPDQSYLKPFSPKLGFVCNTTLLLYLQAYEEIYLNKYTFVYLCSQQGIYLYPFFLKKKRGGDYTCARRWIKMAEVKEGKKGKTSLFNVKREIRNARKWAMAAK